MSPGRRTDLQFLACYLAISLVCVAILTLILGVLCPAWVRYVLAGAWLMDSLRESVRFNRVSLRIDAARLARTRAEALPEEPER